MTWIKFDSAFKEQGDVYINPEHVLSVQGESSGRHTNPVDWKDGPRSVVSMHAFFEEVYYVLGTPAEVVAKLKEELA